MAKIKLNIDGREVTGYKGQTILQVAEENGIDIPNLCYDDRLKVYGACGLCVVEIEGMPKLLRACATEISPGMIVKTRSPKIDQSRKMALELMLSNHTGDCKAPCQRACPAQTDCQGYVGLIANGEYEQAVALIKEKLPFPASIGRVCPHPCEDACRRNFIDQPVAIAALKRFVGDIVLERGKDVKINKKPPTGKKVAIVGGGPAGLTCGYYLALEGHKPVVYEAMPQPGGMLRYGIPQYRLPKDVLDKEIAQIKEMGVEIITNVKVGKDISFSYLLNNYDAVFVAIGAWKSSRIGCPGEDLEGVYGGIEFLIKVAQNKSVKIGNTVAVIGGGNTAMDAARTAVRLGAERVLVIYRRTIEEMPAEEIEIIEAKEEGVEFHFLLSPVEVIGEGGKVSKLRCQKMKMGEPDASGRRRPVPIEGEEVTFDVDTVIAAIGQQVDSSGLESLVLTKWGTIQYDEATFQTSLPGVFAGGDGATGPGIAIEAIAQGKKAARAISDYLAGKLIPVKEQYYVTREDLTKEDFADKERIPRVEQKVREPASRKNNFLEISERYREEEAKQEASRCLECGCRDLFECKLICYSNIYGVEPEKLAGEKSHPDFEDNHPFIDRDPNKCILCGLCVRICNEVTGLTVLGFVNRGFETTVMPEFGMKLQDTDCISCGQCVSVCPVGALQEKLPVDKAVPVQEEQHSTVCSYCSLGCNIKLTSKGSMLLRALPDRESPVDGGLLCAKGRFGFGYVQDRRRITKPMIRIDGRLKEVTWEEAFTYTAKQINSIRSKHGNNSVAVLVSPRYTNEESFLLTRLAKECLVTDNVASSANSFNTDLEKVLGYNASSNTLDELASTDLILYVGGELYQNHPIMGMKILSAVKQGAKLVTISPAKIRTGEGAEIEVYGDNSLDIFKGILKHSIKILNLNQEKVDKRAVGFAQLEEALKSTDPSPIAVKIAELYNRSRSAMIVIDECTVSKEAAKLLANLAVITGKIGSPRKGIILLKPFSNSQGVYDMGIRKSAEEINWREVKAAILFGEELTAADPADLDLLVVQDLFLTPSAEKAQVVLPAASFAESTGTYTNAERRIQKLEASLAPKGGLTNLEVLEGLAKAFGVTLETDLNRLWNSIKSSIPEYYHVFMEDICLKQAFWAPDGYRILYSYCFNFDDGKARLYIPSEGKAFKEIQGADSLQKFFQI
ncbi:NAD(P)-binding protein [Calderihabitans maritimus]|uniref:FAD-dependent pyridine nucleotide-disulfide oxidoreductase n=1 Tax=Calderihabitans maritimus TaxID=1246530 RepID=A0A1Z5HRU5_9FIRM|nr:NAD(P)-binding protein [Calderihabitans maritimus]GAW91990.1 FAD-dependent pyridine nucleotide-disulfide oxidoreductase [Calderihabitans maritimus]